MSVPFDSSRRPVAGRPIQIGPELSPVKAQGSVTLSPSQITGSRSDHSHSVKAVKKLSQCPA